MDTGFNRIQASRGEGGGMVDRQGRNNDSHLTRKMRTTGKLSQRGTAATAEAAAKVRWKASVSTNWVLSVAAGRGVKEPRGNAGFFLYGVLKREGEVDICVMFVPS